MLQIFGDSLSFYLLPPPSPPLYFGGLMDSRAQSGGGRGGQVCECVDWKMFIEEGGRWWLWVKVDRVGGGGGVGVK